MHISAPVSPTFRPVRGEKRRTIKDMLRNPRAIAGGQTVTAPVLEDLKAEYEATVKSIFEIADNAKAHGRDAGQLTDEEFAKAQELYQKQKELKEDIEKAEGRADFKSRIDSLGLVDPSTAQPSPTPQGGLKSLGDQFIDSPQYKALLKRGMQGNWTTGPVELKATLTTDAASGGDLIMPQVQGGIVPLLFRRLTVADLMPSGTTNSNTVRVLKETTATNAAAATAEGAAKPESTLIFDQVDEPVRKIATFLPVSDEMLEDTAQIRSYIDNRLRLFIQLTEEDQLLNGSGVAPNLTGILNRAGIQTQALGADTRADAIYKGMTKIRVTGLLEPDGLVVHPNDWQDIRLAKDGNNQYFGGGPFTGAYGNNGIAADSLWGMRAVVTPAIAEGTALVGAFAASAQVFRRGGITVESSNSHSDFFQKNLTAIRAEERLALAVYRAAGFCTITGI